MRRQHESASAAFAAYGGYRFTVQRDGSDRWRAAIHCDGDEQLQSGRDVEPHAGGNRLFANLRHSFADVYGQQRAHGLHGARDGAHARNRDSHRDLGD